VQIDPEADGKKGAAKIGQIDPEADGNKRRLQGWPTVPQNRPQQYEMRLLLYLAFYPVSQI
jgi:hypothetical protein